jgi:hypothetical protein
MMNYSWKRSRSRSRREHDGDDGDGYSARTWAFFGTTAQRVWIRLKGKVKPLSVRGNRHLMLILKAVVAVGMAMLSSVERADDEIRLWGYRLSPEEEDCAVGMVCAYQRQNSRAALSRLNGRVLHTTV